MDGIGFNNLFLHGIPLAELPIREAKIFLHLHESIVYPASTNVPYPSFSAFTSYNIDIGSSAFHGGIIGHLFTPVHPVATRDLVVNQ